MSNKVEISALSQGDKFKSGGHYCMKIDHVIKAYSNHTSFIAYNAACLKNGELYQIPRDTIVEKVNLKVEEDKA